MKTVAVFFGGRSSEHEISIITGMYAVNLLRGAGYRVLPVYLPLEGGMCCSERLRAVEEFADGPKSLKAASFAAGGLRLANRRRPVRVDCALNCCHGGMGEGGTLSALLDWYQIPSASPSAPESAIFLDKSLAKMALRGAGAPVLPAIALREEEWQNDRAGATERVVRFGLPVIVKPSKLGSSVGISVAKTEAELCAALDFAFRLDEVALAERYLADRRDLNIAVYRSKGRLVTSPVEEVFSDGPILSFGEKYEGTGARASKIPADLPEDTARAIDETARKIYEQFGMRGIVRADVLLGDGQIYFNEINTVPGTLATYLFGESLLTARDLLCELVEEGCRRDPPKPPILSGILSRGMFGGKSAKRP